MSLNIAINKPEKIAGIYSIMNRLLLQGTKTRSAEQLANELDANAIHDSLADPETLGLLKDIMTKLG